MSAPAKPDLLIVDDDPLISDTLEFVLSRDFHVHAAASRQQARSVLRQLTAPPPLALIDLGLPPSPHRPDEGFQLITELIEVIARPTLTLSAVFPVTDHPEAASPGGNGLFALTSRRMTASRSVSAARGK